MAKRRVIDISEFQPDNIDWKKIKDAGYWVILRIGIRGSVKKNAQYYGKIRFDFKFHKFLAAVKKYGIPYSIYFFPAGINDDESREEADWIIRQIKDRPLSCQCLYISIQSSLIRAMAEQTGSARRSVQGS